VSRESDEQRLQDYLDGRLSDGGREAFESQLEEDPELAKRLEFYREIRRSLRDGEEELSPRFYARARARFEAASGGSRRRRFRPLFWETIGLAAATALAAALFLPEVLIDGNSAPQSSLETPSSLTVRSQAVVSERESATADLAERAPEKAAREPAPRGAPETSRAAALSGGERIAEDSARPKRKKETGTVENRSRAKGDSSEEEERFAPAPPLEGSSWEEPIPPASEVGEAGPTGGAFRTSDEIPARQVEPDRREESKAAQAAPKPAAEAGRTTAYRVEKQVRLPGTPLPEGVVEPGSIRSIETREEWDALRERVRGEPYPTLRPYDPSLRLVLIGAGEEPFECARLSVLVTEGSYRFNLGGSESPETAAIWGCACTLPRDGRTIETTWDLKR
jgi:hypothetical protein